MKDRGKKMKRNLDEVPPPKPQEGIAVGSSSKGETERAIGGVVHVSTQLHRLEVEVIRKRNDTIKEPLVNVVA